MPRITQQQRFERVEHILGSGVGVLDFAIEGDDEYYTWSGTEMSDWVIEDVGTVENAEEDRFIIYPEGKYFTCKIDADREEENTGSVRCWCESTD